jgi:hypothetical protein
VFQVCLSLILAIFQTNIKREVMKALKLVEENGDMEDKYITSKELVALKVADYCNLATFYIHDRAGKLSAYKEDAAGEEVYPYVFHFPEVDELKDIGGPRFGRGYLWPWTRRSRDGRSMIAIGITSHSSNCKFIDKKWNSYFIYNLNIF